jgi:hypothetical protein
MHLKIQWLAGRRVPTDGGLHADWQLQSITRSRSRVRDRLPIGNMVTRRTWSRVLHAAGVPHPPVPLCMPAGAPLLPSCG